MSVSTKQPLHIIVYSSTSLPNDFAHPIQILKTVRALAELPGVRVTLYCVCMNVPADQIWRAYGLEPPAGVKIKSMIPRWYFRLFRMNNHISIDNNIIFRWVRWRLGRELIREARLGPVAIYTRNENAIQLLRFAARKAGVPIFMEIHWLKYVDRFRKYVMRKRERTGSPPTLGACKQFIRKNRARERACLKYATGILCLTGQLQRILERWNLGVRLGYLPSGVEVNEEPLAPSAGPPIDILYVGQLYPWKGVDNLIHAMQHLEGRRLTIVGGNRDKDLHRVRRLARKLGVEERVELTGHVPHEQVRDYIGRASVCVIPLPRKGFREARFFTSPMKLFEFAVQGRAIVATDLPSLRESLVHGQNAWLCPPDDPKALADAIERVLGDGQLRQQLAAGALELARRHAYPIRAQAILDFCQVTFDELHP